MISFFFLGVFFILLILLHFLKKFLTNEDLYYLFTHLKKIKELIHLKPDQYSQTGSFSFSSYQYSELNDTYSFTNSSDYNYLCYNHSFHLYPGKFFKSYVIDKYIDEFPSTNFKDCSLCNYSARNYNANSCERDLLITTTFFDVFGFISSIRSLRTTGCKATYVVLSDSDTIKKRITPDALKIFQQCGGFLFTYSRIGTFPRVIVFTQRQVLVHNFLFQRMHLFDRVISFDMFDTVFQGDPFTTELSTDRLYLIQENNKFRLVYHERYFKSPKYKNMTKYDYENQYIINGGTLMGGIIPIIQYLEFFLDSIDYYEMSYLPDDQNALNEFIITGRLDHCGFKYQIFDIYSYYTSVCRQGAANHGEMGSYQPLNSKVYPVLIHQYDSLEYLRKSFAEKCPSKWNINQYIRLEDGHNTIPNIEQPRFSLWNFLDFLYEKKNGN